MPAAALRLGLIGAGQWGRHYIRTLAELDGVTLVRLAERGRIDPALVGDGVEIYSDWQSLLAAGSLDGVIVATPPAIHAEIARSAIEAGLPVLVEKPLTLSADEARDLLALARERAVPVIVDHTLLFHPAWPTLKRRARALLPIRRIESIAGNWGPFRMDVPVLWDWGPHDLAMLLNLLGQRPIEIDARREAPDGDAPGGGETVYLALRFAGDASAEVTLSNVLGAKTRRFEVRFRDRALVFDNLAAEPLTEHPLRDRSLGEGVSIPVAPELPLTRAVAAFADAIRRRRADLSSLALGVMVVELLEALDSRLGGGSPCAA